MAERDQKASNEYFSIPEIPQAFRTTDFDFAACVMALPQGGEYPKVELLDVLPYSRSAKAAGRGYRFSFFLWIPADRERSVELLRELQMQYVSGKLVVEPYRFSGVRQQLRSMMDSYAARNIADVTVAQEAGV